jgi:hypothetical protein
LWRLGIGILTSSHLSRQMFRNDDSTPALPDDTPCLPLAAFISPRDVSLVPLDTVIAISYETLYSSLERAERCDEDSRCGEVAALPPGIPIRKRQRTPDEQLRDEDE